MRALTQRLRDLLTRMRIEEIVAAIFFLPMAFFTFLYCGRDGYARGTEARFYFTLGMIAVYIFLLARYSHKRWVRVMRDLMPFAFCIAIYTNLHDLVYFVHPDSIDHILVLIDQSLFGIQLPIYLQQFRPDAWIHWLQGCYSAFFYFPFLLGLTLYLQKKYPAYREFLVTIILTFFAGYFLYVVFPAVGPKIYFKSFFDNPQYAGWQAEEKLYRFFNIAPSARRDAFPSLHNAITLLVLLFAFRFERRFFWIALPFALSLMIATVWLGHHYVIDVLAGWALALGAFWAFPRWERRRRTAIPVAAPNPPGDPPRP